MLLVGGRAGQHVDHRGVAEALGDGHSHLRDVRGGAVLIDLVLGRRQIAGIGIERVQQAVQRAVGHLGDVGLGDVVVLDLAQNLGVDARSGGRRHPARRRHERRTIRTRPERNPSQARRRSPRKSQTRSAERIGTHTPPRRPQREAGRTHSIDVMIPQVARGKPQGAAQEPQINDLGQQSRHPRRRRALNVESRIGWSADCRRRGAGKRGCRRTF